MNLKEAFGLKKGESLSLIGAGGKTTALYSLARELWEEGQRVLVTTTTKIFKPTRPHVHRLFLSDDLGGLIGELGKIREPVIAGAGYGLDDSGKLLGLPSEWFDFFKRKGLMDSILIEADGAAMKPFKVPAEHEPVVPDECPLTIWVVGIKVLGRPLASQWVHRAERAATLLGVKPGTTVTEDLVLKLVENPLGCLKGIPLKSRKIALLNQADNEEEIKKASDLGHMLLGYGLERVVITSFLSSDRVKAVLTTAAYCLASVASPPVACFL